MSNVSWENSATNIPVKQKRRTRATAPVYYPIFGEAANFTTDYAWIQILEKAQKGIFPSGFSYAKETFFYKSRNGNEDSLQVKTIDPAEFFELFRSFLNKNGFYTNMDKAPNIIVAATVNGDDWGEMSAAYRQAVIDKYVRSEKIKNKLNYEETVALFGVIRVGFLIGAFSKESVIVKDFTIVSIEGLMNEGKRYFIDTNIAPVVKASPKTKTTHKPKKTYNDFWDIFNQAELAVPKVEVERIGRGNNNLLVSGEEEDFTPVT